MRPTPPDAEDPIEDEDFEDSWEPPQPVLGGPLQLLAAVLAAFVAVVILLGAAAAVSWLFR